MRTVFSLRLWSPALVVAAVVATACSSSDTPATSASTTGSASTGSTASSGGGGATSTTTSTTTSASTGGSGPTCMGPGYSGNEMKFVAGAVTATIVDQTGAPVANQPIFICGIDLCSNPGKTSVSGSATISTTDTEKKPAFKFGDAIAYAEFGIPLTAMATDFMTIATAKFPAAGATMTPGADATSGDLTISIPAGSVVTVNDLVYGTDDQQKLRAAEIPTDMAQAILDPTMNFEILYGVAPAETLFCPAAKVAVANSPAWPAGTKVEFWTTTIDTAEDYAPYAGWAKISDGTVSADGMTVATDDGAGFEYLDNFAVRKAQ